MLLMSSLRLMTSCWGSLPPPQGCPPPQPDSVGGAGELSNPAAAVNELITPNDPTLGVPAPFFQCCAAFWACCHWGGLEESPELYTVPLMSSLSLMTPR